MKSPATRTITLIVVAVSALTALSLLTLGVALGTRRTSRRVATQCHAPAFAGPVVVATLINTGGPMKRTGGAMHGGMMRLSIDRSAVHNGPVSFIAVNFGTVNHELLVLPLQDGQVAGTRQTDGEDRIDETSSVGETSKTCGQGAGDGIAPATSGWNTLDLKPGRYELVCDLPGHYNAGMYTQLTIP